jgi:hypothetical protein
MNSDQSLTPSSDPVNNLTINRLNVDSKLLHEHEDRNFLDFLEKLKIQTVLEYFS